MYFISSLSDASNHSLSRSNAQDVTGVISSQVAQKSQSQIIQEMIQDVLSVVDVKSVSSVQEIQQTQTKVVSS
jgi:hypothetical protein